MRHPLGRGGELHPLTCQARSDAQAIAISNLARVDLLDGGPRQRRLEEVVGLIPVLRGLVEFLG